MKEIKNRIFPFIIALSALSVSASAAFYSVTGLSKLFAGAETQVIIMAGSLEVAKLVIASLLYQYWDEINKTLRVYLSTAAVVLVLITSMGIYGYLSAAYQVTVEQAKAADAQVELLETKKLNFVQQREIYNVEKRGLIDGINQLQSGLANNKTSYVDRKGNLIQSTNSTNTRSFDKQLDRSNTRQSEISSKLDVLNDSIFKIDTQIVETKASNSKAGELGPLIYLSKLSGMPMDNIINYLLLVIIFVFDPLAIALVISANFAFARLREPDPVLDNFKSNVDRIEMDDWDSTVLDGLEYEPWDEFEDEQIEPEQFAYQLDELANDIEVKDEEYLQFPNMQENVETPTEERILEPEVKKFQGGNFRVRPPKQDDNVIDYN
jgi:hypothetical protein